MTKTILLIPARMASTRLPNKPLADIGGKPMIVHVMERAKEADLGDVVVAAGDKEIVEVVSDFGGKAVLTNPGLPSGSDRIDAALKEIDPQGDYDLVLNFQGDLPTIDAVSVRAAHDLLQNPGVDISTLVCEITQDHELQDPSVVKAVLAENGRALYFSRACVPAGDGPVYHHIGLYGYQRAALQKFVSLPPSMLEKREKLEQLRALEAGMSLFAAKIHTVPLGVDTPADLELARELLLARSA